METSTLSAEKPHLVIRPTTGWAALNLGELLHYRDLLLTLAARDIKLRYRQTALGPLWVLLQPVMAAGIFTFVFGTIAHLNGNGKTPYFAFSYAAMAGWGVFQNTLSRVSTCLVGNTHLVSKVYFPRLILAGYIVFSVLVDFVISLLTMIPIMLCYHIAPTPALLALPIWVLLTLMLSMGFGLFCAGLMVSYRDVNYVLPI